MWHQGFNRNFLKLREYILCKKNKKNNTLLNNLSPSSTLARKRTYVYYRNLSSLRYGNEYCVEDALWEKLIFSSSTEAFFNHAV